MRVLGIDCGSQVTGFGIIDTDGRQHRLVAAGVICPKANSGLPARLKEIAERLRALIREHQPDAVAVEEVFQAVNPRTALKLAHVQGVAMLAAAEAGLPVAEYSPLEIKMSVVGYGRAEKSQVQRMVAALTRTEGALFPYDAADAVAVAICHATRVWPGSVEPSR